MDQMQAVELLIQSQAEQIRQLTEANAKLSGQLVYFGLIGFFVKFGAGYPELESTTFRLNSSNPALPYIVSPR